MKNAFTFGSAAILSGMAFFMHGILPFAFEHEGSQRVSKLNNDIQSKIQAHSTNKRGAQNDRRD